MRARSGRSCGFPDRAPALPACAIGASAQRSMIFWQTLGAGSASSASNADRSRATRDEWYDASWNPTAGCSTSSSGCEHCWAMRVAAQLARMGGATGQHYAGLTKMEQSALVWTGETRIRGDLLTWPLFRRRPRRIAVDLMSDLFHETLSTATIDLLHSIIAIAHWHTFIVLTKRAERMREY